MAPAPAPPPNVLLISLDTLRPDRMSLYGAARETTPVLDALARRGVRFTNAFSPSPWTLPAHAAMLSGRYPARLSRDADAPLYALAPLLSTMLLGRGYATAAVTGGAFVAADFGADRGFERFAVGDVADAVAWIDGRAAGRPFFLFFHTYAVHMPYRDRRFAAGMDGGRLAAIYEGEQPAWEPLHMAVCCTGLELTDQERAFLLALYDGGIAAADAMVGALLAALERAGERERTIVIVTSDHGEEFWEHTGRAAYHGHTLYDELLRVPLLWVDSTTAAGGTRHEPVGLIDLVPTVLGRLGIPVPDDLDGVDLGPLLDGAPWPVARELFAEGVRHGPPRYAVRGAAGKLIVAPHPHLQRGEAAAYPLAAPARRELYLPGDAREQRNRSAAAPALTAALLRDLRAHRREAAPATPLREPALDPTTHERLRALGYVP